MMRGMALIRGMNFWPILITILCEMSMWPTCGASVVVWPRVS